MIRYAFRPVARVKAKADPQTYGEAISALGDEHGYVSPDRVWKAARSAAHPLHGEFEWNKTKASEAHWRERSRQLIGAIYIVAEDNKPTRPAYFNIRVVDRGRQYVPEDQIATDAMFRFELLQIAVRDLRVFRRRFAHMTFVCQPIDTAIEAAEAHLAAAEAATREAAE